jgi:hypothetical protein
MKMKMLKATVSGSFRTEVMSDKNRHPFDNVKGIIPAHDWEWHITHAQRMFPIWVEKDKQFNGVNYEGIIKLRVDNVEEIEAEPVCLHKDIKEMTWEELMSLACYKKLRGIPHYKKGDIRFAREKAYREYEEHVNGKRVFTSPKELTDFRTKMAEKELSESEIEGMVRKAFNMVVDLDRPDTSYNFVNLPPLFVDGEVKKPVQSDTKGSDK